MVQMADVAHSCQSCSSGVKLDMLRVAGLEVAFVFTITFDVGDSQMRLQPVDTAVFDDDGKITRLRSYFAPSDVTTV